MGPLGLPRIEVMRMNGRKMAKVNIMANCCASRMLFVTAPIAVISPP